MDIPTATMAFAALSQPTRLEAFRLLAQAGPDGLRAGAIADHLGVVASTLSHHLAQLEQAGLVHSRRQGRHIIYACHPTRPERLCDYLIESCGTVAAEQRTPFGPQPVAARG